MAVGERSIADVLQDIAGDVQEIVRSEVKLAKTEVAEEIAKVKAAAPLLIVGAVAAWFAALFLVWAAVFALGVVLPMWAAALVVMGCLAIVGGVALAAGVKTLLHVSPPERTIESVKEDAVWAQQQVK